MQLLLGGDIQAVVLAGLLSLPLLTEGHIVLFCTAGGDDVVVTTVVLLCIPLV
jgi:hypothetical protein